MSHVPLFDRMLQNSQPYFIIKNERSLDIGDQLLLDNIPYMELQYPTAIKLEIHFLIHITQLQKTIAALEKIGIGLVPSEQQQVFIYQFNLRDDFEFNFTSTSQHSTYVVSLKNPIQCDDIYVNVDFVHGKQIRQVICIVYKQEKLLQVMNNVEQLGFKAVNA